MDLINKLFNQLFKSSRAKPSGLALYLHWYNRDNNWLERITITGQLERLLWNKDIFNPRRSVSSTIDKSGEYV